MIHVATGSSTVPPVKYDGTTKDIFYLTRALAKLGCDVIVIDSKTEPIKRKDSHTHFLEVWNPPLGDAGRLRHILRIMIFALLSTRTLHRVVKKEHPDIIHLHSQFPAAAVLLSRWFFHRDVPLIHNTHNTIITMQTSRINRFKHSLEVFAFKQADFVMSDTESTKKRIHILFKIPMDKIFVRPEGIDTIEIDEFIKTAHPELKSQKGKIVIYPAVIDPRKNQMGLIKAVPDILRVHPDTTFVLPGPIGNRPYYESLQNQIAESNLTDHIQFSGELPLVPDLFRLYGNADIFVFPTLYETQGVVLLEAMAFGLPCAASNIGPILDIAGADGSSALLFDPRDTSAIAHAVVPFARR